MFQEVDFIVRFPDFNIFCCWFEVFDILGKVFLNWIGTCYQWDVLMDMCKCLLFVLQLFHILQWLKLLREQTTSCLEIGCLWARCLLLCWVMVYDQMMIWSDWDVAHTVPLFNVKTVFPPDSEFCWCCFVRYFINGSPSLMTLWPSPSFQAIFTCINTYWNRDICID